MIPQGVAIPANKPIKNNVNIFGKTVSTNGKWVQVCTFNSDGTKHCAYVWVSNSSL